MSGARVCVVADCIALPARGGFYCAVHLTLTVRTDHDACIHCYACGGLVRIGRRWVVREEGALHLRVACLMTPVENWKIQRGPCDTNSATRSAAAP